VTVNREEIHQRILKEQKALNGNGVARTPVPKAQIPIRMVKASTRTLSVLDKS
jgi:hypothetical protein